nr:flagellar biosynthesis regulator FlaF [Pseudoruegeria sp. HB172150]
MHLARTAYAISAAPIRTHQSTEYDAFAQITRRMKEAAGKGRRGFNALASAVHDNRRLWTLLAGDVADKDNTLPQGLRAQIFYLAEFTHQHSPKVLNGSASADILIDINTAVMRGLRQQELAAP